jgi:acid phosphatase type 7
VAQSSSAAGGGQEVAFFSNGSASSGFDGAATNITLRARGGACRGNPQLKVYVDGALKGTVDLTSSSFADYAIALSDLSSGTHTLRVSFENDYRRGNCNRSAYLDYSVLSLPDPPPPSSPVLVGAGKIASCSSSGDAATSKLLDSIPGTVFTAGDNAYADGTPAEYNDCYNPTWGRHKARTKPTPGQHDYNTPGASGYFGYFGAAAGDPSKGYYSYDLGEWHVIALNTQCAQVGGCGATSPMLSWLKQDLAANSSTCTLAYFHHSLFSSGSHGNQTKVRPIWDALYAANADVVVNGRDHDYERFAPQDPSGVADASRGIREFVVGTGGAFHAPFGTIQPNSEVRNADTYGVVKFTLHPRSYDWNFVPVAGQTFTDSGTTSCH